MPLDGVFFLPSCRTLGLNFFCRQQTLLRFSCLHSLSTTFGFAAKAASGGLADCSCAERSDRPFDYGVVKHSGGSVSGSSPGGSRGSGGHSRSTASRGGGWESEIEIDMLQVTWRELS